MIDLDLTLPLDRFTLSLRWSSAERACGIFGPSGSGKTTILEAIAGLRRDARGSIRVAGETWLDTTAGIRLPPERRGVGYVPQDLLLFPHLDVAGNLLAGRRRARSAGARDGSHPDPDRVMQVLELEALRHRPVAVLSGGERQRVALGRALCSGPRILLLDEPLAALDAPLRRRVMPYLLRVREEFGIPAVYVSHEASEMWLLCRDVIVIESGRIRSQGPPAAIFTYEPGHAMARLDGFENVLTGRAVEVGSDTARVRVGDGMEVQVPAEGFAPGARVWLGVRAEDLILALSPPVGLSARNVLPGRVVEVRRSGGHAEVLVEAGGSGSPLVVALTRGAVDALSLEAGASVHLVAKVRSFRILAWI